ncbi:MAG: 4-hydroxyphenylacetate 3-hydroxylase N-terminal domain-containing protein, partial [Desulfotomaculales bacterium]
MALKTADEYLQSLRKMKTKVYLFGEAVENFVDHPVIRPSVNAVAKSYELAFDGRYSDLLTVSSSLTGETVNRFTHLHQSTDD